MAWFWRGETGFVLFFSLPHSRERMPPQLITFSPFLVLAVLVKDAIMIL